MNAFAKVLAVVVLLGSVLGIGGRILSFVVMAQQGVLERLFAEAGAASVFIGQAALGVFFALCGIALAIMVLAAPGPLARSTAEG